MNFRGAYLSGQPYGICDRCGFRKRLGDLRTEWSNSKVCDDCYDPEPVHLHTPVIDPGEGRPIPGARPEIVNTVPDADLDFGYRDGVTNIYPQFGLNNQTLLLDDDGTPLIDEDGVPLVDE